MEESQDIVLTQMRQSIEKLGFSTEKYGNPTLTRFLVARSMNPEKAAKMIVKWRQWRSSMVPNGFILDSEVPDKLEAKETYLQGLSKDGYRLMVVKASKHFPPKDQLQFKSNNGCCVIRR